jgi:hypothetical protein
MIAAPTKTHVVRFIEAEANGCERLEFFVLRFPLFLCFAIKYSLRVFAPYVRTPYRHLSSWDYTKKVIIPQETLHGTFLLIQC